MNHDFIFIPCRGCGARSETIYCAKCADQVRCPHDEPIGECQACDRIADLAYDACREDD